jgi:hypothetical protein
LRPGASTSEEFTPLNLGISGQETRTPRGTAIYWPRVCLIRARTEMSLKHRTTEQWMRIGFTVLVLVGVVCTLLIVVAKLR